MVLVRDLLRAFFLPFSVAEALSVSLYLALWILERGKSGVVLASCQFHYPSNGGSEKATRQNSRGG